MWQSERSLYRGRRFEHGDGYPCDCRSATVPLGAKIETAKEDRSLYDLLSRSFVCDLSFPLH
jgi:hypothetical protein